MIRLKAGSRPSGNCENGIIWKSLSRTCNEGLVEAPEKIKGQRKEVIHANTRHRWFQVEISGTIRHNCVVGNHAYNLRICCMRFRDRLISFFKTDIFKNFPPIFAQLYTDIRLANDTDIPKFANRYIYQYFNKLFWLKLMWIAYSPDLQQPN